MNVLIHNIEYLIKFLNKKFSSLNVAFEKKDFEDERIKETEKKIKSFKEINKKKTIKYVKKINKLIKKAANHKI